MRSRKLRSISNIVWDWWGTQSMESPSHLAVEKLIRLLEDHEAEVARRVSADHHTVIRTEEDAHKYIRDVVTRS